MPFCTTCGSSVEGKFCIKCGTPVGAPAAAPPVATYRAAAQPVAAPQPVAPRKKTSPLVWILVAVVGLFLLLGIAVIGGGFFLVHKAKQAGLDPALWEKNPGLAATKLLTAANPDVQVLRIDEGKGLVTLKDKKTGKIVTLDFDAIKEGRISFQDEATGESVTLGGGSAVKIPAWVPSYPGSKPEGTFSAQGGEGQGGMFAFKTGDGPKKVLDWYQQSLEGAGFKVEANASGETGGIITAEDTSKRSVMVTTGGEGGETGVQVTYSQK